MELDKQKIGLLEGALSSGINVGLFALKLWMGVATGSIAMIADAWHTLSDTFTSLVVILGFWIGGKPRDEEHPFGHGRAELVGSVIIGTLLAVVGVNFLTESVGRLRIGVRPRFTTGALVVFGASALVKEALARFSIWAGKKTGSHALVADGWHHRSDAVASALIVVGAVVGRRIEWLDAALGIAVALLILYAAYEVLSSAVKTLLGENVDNRTTQAIVEVLRREAPEIEDAHHIHVHRYGDHVEATLHVSLPAGCSLEQAHETTDRLEKALRRDLSIEPTIHMEPAAK